MHWIHDSFTYVYTYTYIYIYIFVSMYMRHNIHDFYLCIFSQLHFQEVSWTSRLGCCDNGASWTVPSSCSDFIFSWRTMIRTSPRDVPGLPLGPGVDLIDLCLWRIYWSIQIYSTYPCWLLLSIIIVYYCRLFSWYFLSFLSVFIRHWAGYKRSLGLRLGHAWWWLSKENLVNYCKPCVVWMWNYSRNHIITMPIIYEIFSFDRILTIYWARNTLKKWWEKSEGQNGHPQYEETIRMHVSCGLLPFLSLVCRHVLNMFLCLT